MMPLISIIIPCYNDAEYIEQSVQSALNQTYSNIEVIVVDDGSNTATKEVLKMLEPNIKQLITQKNLGQSKARNAGIEVAKGDYVLVLDSDDFFELSFCEEAVQVFLNHSNVKIVSCFANVFGLSKKNELYKPKGGDIQIFKFENGVLGTSMFKRKDWEDVNGYDDQMKRGFEDWEFFIRILKFEGIAFVIQKPLYNYRKREISTSTEAIKIRYDLWNYIFTKHKDLYESDIDGLISFFINKLKQVEKNKNKYREQIDYKIGALFLKPFRFVKSIF